MTSVIFRPANPEALEELKDAYCAAATAPLDGMWLAFARFSDHYAIAIEDKIIGYAALNSDQKLLQFQLASNAEPTLVFNQFIDEVKVCGAIVSTAEPLLLGLALDHQKTLQVNALMYHLPASITRETAAFPESTVFSAVSKETLPQAVNFATETLGADRDWLSSYFSGLVSGEELYGLWLEDDLIATGECRPNLSYPRYADVGMVVSPNHRRQGLATHMLRQLIEIAEAKALKPICSTEHDNLGAQRAITNAGFVSYQRILDIGF